MGILLKYHNTQIEVPDPPVREIKTLTGGNIEPLSNPADSLLLALDNPIESPPLRDMIPPRGYVCILVSDITRKTRMDVVLPVILNYLNNNGVGDERIRILVCIGTHKRHTEEQLIKIVGSDCIGRFDINETHQENPDDYIYTGNTDHETPVYFHKVAVDSSLIIATGGITFHYFAGFSGGRKSFIPGLARVDTIQTNHSLTYLKVNGEGKRNPNCESARLDGNPVSEDMEDGFKLMPTPSFLVNLILNPTGEVAGICTGDVISAHRQGCERFKALYSIPIDREADIVLASAGGYPSDINLLQSHKSMINCEKAVKKQGTIFLSARCSEGISLSGYPDFMKTHSRAELIDRLISNYEIHGGTTDNLMNITDNAKLFLMSDIDNDTLKAVGVTPFKAGENSWDDIFRGLSGDSLCYVMPDASKFMPVLKS